MMPANSLGFPSPGPLAFFLLSHEPIRPNRAARFRATESPGTITGGVYFGCQMAACRVRLQQKIASLQPRNAGDFLSSGRAGPLGRGNRLSNATLSNKCFFQKLRTMQQNRTVLDTARDT